MPLNEFQDQPIGVPEVAEHRRDESANTEVDFTLLWADMLQKPQDGIPMNPQP
jgi:hypothetical protein